jgi:phosphoglycolate phosphatase
MASSSLIVFDLDGTLVDTAPDLIAALNVILRKEGIPELPLATARNLIGGGARKLIERGLEAGGRNCTVAEIDHMMKDFIVYYAEHIADLSRPFEGLDDALDELAAQGAAFAVCTNKLEWLSKLLLARHSCARQWRVRAAAWPRRSWSATPEPTSASPAGPACR